MNALPALQATLAGEHAAVYLYGVLGGRISVSPAAGSSAAGSSPTGSSAAGSSATGSSATGSSAAGSDAKSVPDLKRLVRAAYTVHRSRRDQLTARIRGLGAQPAAAHVAYRLPGPARTVRQVAAAAGEVERRSCAVYADLVAGTSGPARLWAVRALTDAAVRSLGFGALPDPFPGVTEL